ncbi:MAG: hypothetical protein Kow0029_13680 [Candidatus Rifleibacteriota bacterium]
MGLSAKKTRLSENLYCIQIKLPFRSANFRVMQRVVIFLAGKLLQKKLDHNLSNSILWIADPSMAGISNENFKYIIYDRCDLHGAFPGQKKQVWQLYERELFERADLITYSHPMLEKDIPDRLKDKILLVPNACSDMLLNMKYPKKASGNKLILVSAGAHYEWVDFQWLEMITQIEPVELHIAGSGRGNHFSELLNKNNVVFHGKLNQEELSSVLRRADAGLIPFVESMLTRAVDPIKAYEYAAAGLEIWAPTISGLKENPLIDRFINNKFQLETACKELLGNRNRQKIRKKVPTWGDRLKSILDRYAELSSD